MQQCHYLVGGSTNTFFGILSIRVNYLVVVLYNGTLVISIHIHFLLSIRYVSNSLELSVLLRLLVSCLPNKVNYLVVVLMVHC